MLTDTLTRLTTLSGSALFPPVVVRLSPPDKWFEFRDFQVILKLINILETFQVSLCVQPLGFLVTV